MSETPAKERVAILGGGIASLSAAWYLTHTEALRNRYDVTLYQMGWRVGGKLASGFEEDNGRRNVEHGLHVWFGWYENAFHLFQDLIAEWHARGLAPTDTPIRTWSDAFTGCNFTPLGQTIEGERKRWDFSWGPNSGVPGQGTVLPGPKQLVTGIIGWMEALIEDWLESPANHLHSDVAGSAVSVLHSASALAARAALTASRGAGEALSLVHTDWSWVELEVLRASLAAGQLVLKRLLRHPSHEAGDVDAHFIRNCVDVGHAILRGILNPEYGLLDHDLDLDRLDGLEFREFLIDNGADADIVKGWTILQSLYDAMFEYPDGDRRNGNYAAGVALRVAIRMLLTYRGAALYLLNAGMGSVVIGTLHEVLAARGVKFEFFSKVNEIHVENDSVSAVSLSRQAEVQSGSYQPTVDVQGIPSWPAQPFWDQLVDGDAMKKAGVDFESHWGPSWPGTSFKIVAGKDFDHVVLGMALGAWKRLNDEPDPGRELRAASPRLAAMCEALPLTPSGGVQLWFDRTTVGLGFDDARRAAGVSLIFPMDVWADMTPTLATEDWGLDGPRSVQYLCGVFDTQLYKEPSSASDVPARARALLFDEMRRSLDRDGAFLWPAARTDHGFDWQTLHADPASQGPERLNEQWIRANVDPTECCVVSPAGSTAARVRTDETGITNLRVVGECAYTGVNSTTVESAVMSGMQAARSLTGEPLDVVGETFLAGRWRIP